MSEQAMKKQEARCRFHERRELETNEHDFAFLDGFDAGYEAGKNDGIPQGTLDGYDAGYAAARKKVVADLAQLPSDPPKLYLALLEFIDKLKRDTPEDSDE
jgi:flagellar biosynthesis/type III secretory pathway protein FliH